MKNIIIIIIRNLIILTIVIVPLYLMMVTYFDNRIEESEKCKELDGAFIFLYGIPTMLYEDYMTTKNSNAVGNCTPEPRYWDSPNTYRMNCKIIIK